MPQKVEDSLSFSNDSPSPLPRRKKNKQFTVVNSKKSVPRLPQSNIKPHTKLLRNRSVDLLSEFMRDDKKKPSLTRTRSLEPAAIHLRHSPIPPHIENSITPMKETHGSNVGTLLGSTMKTEEGTKPTDDLALQTPAETALEGKRVSEAKENMTHKCFSDKKESETEHSNSINSSLIEGDDTSAPTRIISGGGKEDFEQVNQRNFTSEDNDKKKSDRIGSVKDDVNDESVIAREDPINGTDCSNLEKAISSEEKGKLGNQQNDAESIHNVGSCTQNMETENNIVKTDDETSSKIRDDELIRNHEKSSPNSSRRHTGELYNEVSSIYLRDLKTKNNSLVSLKNFKLNTLLSQSTGQEHQIQASRSTTQVVVNTDPNNTGTGELLNCNGTSKQNHDVAENFKDTPFPDSTLRQHGSTSKTDTIGTSFSNKSDSSNITNPDSLIFRQSGLTLYNMNNEKMQTTNDTRQFNPSSMVRNVSQPSLHRQESYLSFRVPSKNTNSTDKNKRVESNHQRVGRLEQPTPQKNHAQLKQAILNTNSKTSLLSEQAMRDEKIDEDSSRDKNNDAKIVEIDLSSYLSSQEPEVETRTQQKLWLQRENVASLNVSEEGADQITSKIVNQTTRFQYEKISREFLHIRRHTNPTLDALKRINENQSPKKRLSIDAKSNDLLSKSVAKSMTTGYITKNASLSKSLGLSLKDSNTADDGYTGDLDSFNVLLKTMWKANCADFSEEIPTSNGKAANPSFESQNNVLSSRYGYQPSNTSSSALFSRGNTTPFGTNAHISFGTSSKNRHVTNNHVNNNNHGVHTQTQPTTRFQQHQEQHRQNKQHLRLR